MDKNTLERLINEKLRETIEDMAQALAEEEEKETENANEEDKLIVTISDKTTLIEGIRNQNTLLNGINALCKLLEKEHDMETHEVFMAIEFSNKMEELKGKLGI